MKLSKIPKHIWWGVVFPLVLVGLGGWRLWPKIEEYREADERAARITLLSMTYIGVAKDPQGVLRYRTFERYGYVFMALQLRQSSDICEDCPMSNSYWNYGGLHSNELHKLPTGYCAYPATFDWRHRWIFIANNDLPVYRLDNGVNPVAHWPTDEELVERFTEVDRREWN